MSKYLDLVDGSFTQEHFDKQQTQIPYVAYSVQDDEVIYNIVPNENGDAYTYVDLGLSVKWADRNVGAETPQDSGLYFSWGNVDGHAVDENGNVADGYSFDSTTYSTTLGGQYTGSTLDAEHDAATANMGSEWRMPTSDEISELVEHTDHYYIGEDGSIVAEIDGSKLRSICFVKKGETFDYNDRSNFIEFPFVGYFSGGSISDQKGFQSSVWSSSIYEYSTKYACCLWLYTDGGISSPGSFNRKSGLSVRGVHV